MSLGWLKKLVDISPVILSFTPLNPIAPLITGVIGVVEGTGLNGVDKKTLALKIINCAITEINSSKPGMAVVTPDNLSNAVDLIVKTTNLVHSGTS